MNLGRVQEIIELLNSEEIDYVLDSVIKRKRELYPDWEIVYYAREKSESIDLERIMDLLERK